mmetsp:Transcript_735/g.1256  ORF Transcript_735/g.1256 Transcript_735/m.1256 type:complete len:242 (-) Transcript_735:191-916(-)
MRRSNTPVKQKQGHKQSSSVLALMTNYPINTSSNNNDTTHTNNIRYGKNAHGKSADGVESRLMDGKLMIKLSPDIVFAPTGCWTRLSNPHSLNQYLYISTTFHPTTLSIDSSSGADFFKLQCTGVASLTVNYRDDAMKENTSQASTSGSRRFSRNVRTHEEDIPIPSQHKAVGEPSEEILQEIGFRSPWPCCQVKVSFTGLEGQFISVLNVAVYGESLPSGLSTPIDAHKSGLQGVLSPAR